MMKKKNETGANGAPVGFKVKRAGCADIPVEKCCEIVCRFYHLRKFGIEKQRAILKIDCEDNGVAVEHVFKRAFGYFNMIIGDGDYSCAGELVFRDRCCDLALNYFEGCGAGRGGFRVFVENQITHTGCTVRSVLAHAGKIFIERYNGGER